VVKLVGAVAIEPSELFAGIHSTPQSQTGGGFGFSAAHFGIAAPLATLAEWPRPFGFPTLLRLRYG
jgi:hypothetical protein